MRVIANKAGFYNGTRIAEGEVFEAPEGAKGKWFSKVADKAEAPKKAKVADEGPKTFSELTKRDAKTIAPDLV